VRTNTEQLDSQRGISFSKERKNPRRSSYQIIAIIHNQLQCQRAPHVGKRKRVRRRPRAHAFASTHGRARLEHHRVTDLVDDARVHKHIRVAERAAQALDRAQIDCEIDADLAIDGCGGIRGSVRGRSGGGSGGHDDHFLRSGERRQSWKSRKTRQSGQSGQSWASWGRWRRRWRRRLLLLKRWWCGGCRRDDCRGDKVSLFALALRRAGRRRSGNWHNSHLGRTAAHAELNGGRGESARDETATETELNGEREHENEPICGAERGSIFNRSMIRWFASLPVQCRWQSAARRPRNTPLASDETREMADEIGRKRNGRPSVRGSRCRLRRRAKNFFEPFQELAHRAARRGHWQFPLQFF
jgi:hypothetical protein